MPPKQKILFLLGLILVFCGGVLLPLWMRSRPLPSQHIDFPVMGTVGSITVYGRDRQVLGMALDQAQKTIRDVETRCNIFKPDSELSRLNASAFREEVVCSPLLWEVLREAERFYKLSDGAFDVTVKPLMSLWGFHRKRYTLPSDKEITETMKKVGFDKVKLNPEKHSVRFLSDGIGIDLGGIAKGFALDKAAETLRKCGVENAVVNLGGNIRCLTAPGKPDRVIGIRDPVHTDRIIARLPMRNNCIATSGDYERYVVLNGKHYTHIIHPCTGRPVSDMLSVTVVTPRGVDSDALSTSTFIRGETFAEKICREFPDTGVLMVRRNPADPEKPVISRYGLFRR